MAELANVDVGVVERYQAWREDEAAEQPSLAVSLVVRFEGDPEALVEAGLSVATISGQEALGKVCYADLERLAAVPGVLWISGGSEMEPTMETSVHDITARASSKAKAAKGGDGLWFIDPATGSLAAAPLATGKGVVVAIVDSGIDVTHPMFHNSIDPYDTRILRIWDQGLEPAAGEKRPDSRLILSGNRYGVEYEKSEIDTRLKGAEFPGKPFKFPHRDCVGHGTHVASIAAGGRSFYKPGGDASRVGVAPQADIVMVKLLDVPAEIRDADHDRVEYTTRLRDAITYCLRVAREAPDLGIGPKPVAINCSFGSQSEAGDGLDSDADWLDRTFDPGAAAEAEHFPKGAILVKSAGNDAHPRRRQHATVTIPDSGEVTVPLKLYDPRGPKRTSRIRCKDVDHLPRAEVHCWLRRTQPVHLVSVAARVPTEETFSDDVKADSREGVFDRNKRWKVGQEQVAVVNRPRPGQPPEPVARNHAYLFVTPNRAVTPAQHLYGTYELRFTGPAGSVIHVLCNRGSGFMVAERDRNGNALPGPETIAGKPGIKPIDVNGSHTIVGLCARRVITVAAYDDTGHQPAPPAHATVPHEIAPFSSRGPLRDFSDPVRGPLSAKPDVAAPGAEIDAALSLDSEGTGCWAWLRSFRGGLFRFEAHDGTSMAAPHVTGLVALLLEKKGDLNVDDVRTLLRAAARSPVVPPPGSADAPLAYGAGMVNALKSYEDGTP